MCFTWKFLKTSILRPFSIKYTILPGNQIQQGMQVSQNLVRNLYSRLYRISRNVQCIKIFDVLILFPVINELEGLSKGIRPIPVLPITPVGTVPIGPALVAATREAEHNKEHVLKVSEASKTALNYLKSKVAAVKYVFASIFLLLVWFLDFDSCIYYILSTSGDDWLNFSLNDTSFDFIRIDWSLLDLFNLGFVSLTVIIIEV